MYNFIYDFYGYNKSIFIYINKLTNTSIIPKIFETISLFFSIEKFALYYLIACLYFYFKLKRGSFTNQAFFPRFNKLVEAGTCYALFGFTYAIIKFSINMQRPFCSLNSNEFTTIIDITKERCLSSFPSAHTGLAILISYYLWPCLNQYQKIITCILALLVATSRVTLAMHYPADILYSVFIVSIVIFLNNKLINSMQSKVINPIGKFIARLIA